MSLVLVTGGARSGKSTFAEKFVNNISKNAGYIATAEALDEEMKDRIQIHKKSRPEFWLTYEEPLEVSKLLKQIKFKHSVFLLDCVTMLISNILLKDLNFNNITPDIIKQKEKLVFKELKDIVAVTKSSSFTLVIVTNEVGQGLVPSDPISRGYRDIVGRANQYLAVEADKVILTYAGIPIEIKPDLKKL